MASFNRVVLMGNLTRDPEMRQTNNGISVTNFGLAVNDPRSKNDDVDFFDVTAWRELGQTIANYKKKGDPILIEGKIKFQQFQDKNGNNRSKHIIVCDNVQFLSGNNGNGNGGGSNNQRRNNNNAAPQQQQTQQNTSSVEDDFDDIPF